MLPVSICDAVVAFRRCQALYSGDRCQERRVPVVIDQLEDEPDGKRCT